MIQYKEIKNWILIVQQNSHLEWLKEEVIIEGNRSLINHHKLTKPNKNPTQQL